jgi:hypothetical protein
VIRVSLALQDVANSSKSPSPRDLAEAARVRRLVQRVKQLPDIREEKVRRMRRLIARGRLVTPERIDETARRIVEELKPWRA